MPEEPNLYTITPEQRRRAHAEADELSRRGRAKMARLAPSGKYPPLDRATIRELLKAPPSGRA